jgi:hypothetical protein
MDLSPTGVCYETNNKERQVHSSQRVTLRMHLSCMCATKFAPEGQLRLKVQLVPFLQISRGGSLIKY